MRRQHEHVGFRHHRPWIRLKSAQTNRVLKTGAGDPRPNVGLELTRQYYLRVIAARDNSPAAKAGLRTGDYVRAINDTPTREMSVWEGMRALRGAPGSKVKVIILLEEPQAPVSPKRGQPGSFFDAVRNLKLDGPSDWSEHLDDYLYHGKPHAGEPGPEGPPGKDGEVIYP